MRRRGLLILIMLTFVCLGSSLVGAAAIGDVNEDGTINSMDYTGLRRHILGWGDISADLADVDGDNVVTSNDFTLMRRYVIGDITKFPAEDSNNTGANGFYVEDGKVYDANGNEFIMRGVNHAHTWYKDELDTALSGIADANANVVRIVLSNGGQWEKDSESSIEEIISKCKEHDLVAMLEIHDCTGYGEPEYAPDAVHISTAVDYWIEMKDVLFGEEEYVIINIANEAFGNDVESDTYVNDYITAINRMRDNGFEHSLVVDGHNWGQDWSNTMRDRAPEIFDADPEKNIIFSIHMYEVYNNEYQVTSYMETFLDHNLPLIVGEFGADHKGQEVAEDVIMSRAEEYGFGYIGWSWKGNNSETASLDIALDWAGTSFSSWGQTLVDGENGLKATAEKCSIFE